MDDSFRTDVDHVAARDAYVHDAIGAIVGLVGAVKVYNKWNHGEPDTGKVAAAWFGSCVFLVVVATVIKAFFGV